MNAPKKDKPKHLGRGLESLMGSIINTGQELSNNSVAENKHNLPVDKDLQKSRAEISVSEIVPNPFQPRQTWNDDQLKDLSNSIRENGIIQPIIVRQKGANKYEIIAGERRFRAAQLVGLDKVPAMVRETTDTEMLSLALIENIHRADLNPMERAGAYQKFLETFSLTQEQAAQKLGEDRSVIANHIRLLSLPNEIKQMLTDGTLSMGHARAILALPTDDLRKRLANRALAGRLSVREVERLVRIALTQKDGNAAKAVIEKPAHIKDLESKIRGRLGTNVKIIAGKKGTRGKIVIEYYSLDEFDSIAEKLGVNPD